MDKRKNSSKKITITARDTKPKSLNEKTLNYKTLLGKEDLNIMLYKLKSYYDYIQIMKQTKTKEMGHLKFKHDTYSDNIIETHELGNIDCGAMKQPFVVSILNSKTTKDSKEGIQERLRQLYEEKESVTNKFNNEEDYSYTVNGMVETDKLTLVKTNEEILTINRKLNSIAIAKKNLDINKDTSKKKEENFKVVLNNLKNELKKMNEIMLIQEQGKNQIDLQLSEKKKDLELDLKRFDDRSVFLEKDTRNKKSEVKRNYATYVEKLETKISKEKTYIKTILGVYILQKYFIENQIEDGFDNELFENSLDCKVFESNDVLIVDNEDKILSTEDHPKDHSILTVQSEFTHLTKSKDFNSITTKLPLDELKRRHDGITLKYTELFEFFKKLTSKNLSFKNHTNSLNKKQISLEILKDNCSRRVNDILNRNKHNNLNLAKLFEENSKFKNFMKTFKIEERNYTQELNTAIENNEIETFQTDFYEKTLDFISHIKIVFEAIYNKCKSLYYHQSKALMDKINEFCSKLTNSFEKLAKSQQHSNSNYLDKLITYYKDNRDKEGFVESDFLEKGDRLVEYLGLYKEWILQANLGFTSQVFFSFDTEETFVDLTKSTLDIISLLDKALEGRYASKSRKTLTKKKTMRTGLDIYGKIELNTEPNQDTNILDNSYTSLEEHIDTRRMITEGNKNREHLYTTSTLASEKDLRKAGEFRNIKTSSISQRNHDIIDKFYRPYVDKMKYNLTLNENIADIKKMTSKDARTNNYLEKKNKEVVKISHDLIIYNNPTINLNSLSKETYNSFIKYIMKTQHQLNVKSKSSTNLKKPSKLNSKNT